MKNLQANFEKLLEKIEDDDRAGLALLDMVLDLLDGSTDNMSAFDIAIVLLGNFDEKITAKIDAMESIS